MVSRTRILLLLAIGTALMVGLASCSSDDDNGTTPSTDGVVSGTVVDDTNLAPVVGATVSLEAASPKSPVAASAVNTDAYGRFRLSGVPAGNYDLLVDARTVYPQTGNTDIHYIRIRLSGIAVTAGQERVIAQPVFMPHIDETLATTITGTAPADVGSVDIVGFNMHIGTGAATFPDGTHAGELFVVEVPVDGSPVQLPDRMAPDLLFRVIPEGTTFSPAATITLPNRQGLPASRQLDILEFGPADGTTTLAARGQVSLDGERIEGIAGTGEGGLTSASLYGIACDAHTVTGHIQLVSGGPVAGAHVELLSTSATITGQRMVVPGATATSDAQGNFTIAGVRACLIYVRATYSGASGAGVAQTMLPIQAEADGTTDAGTLVMEIEAGTVAFDIAGTVRFTNGSPAAGIVVQVIGFESPCPELATAGSPGGLPSPAAVAPPYAISDGVGEYRIAGVVAPPDVRFGLISYLESETALLYGASIGTTPALGQNGATVTVNPVVCNPQEVYATCAVGTWSLSGSQLSLVPAPITLQCSQDFGPGEIVVEVLSLVDGVATIAVTETENCIETTHTETFDRAIAGGPTGLSPANFAGVYWRTAQDPPDPGASPMVVAFLANGTFALLEDGNNGMEAGIYSSTGGVLDAEPIFSDGSAEPVQFPYTVSGNTLTITQGEDDIVFTRCSGTSGAALQGMWTNYDPEFNAITQVILGAGEYAVQNIDLTLGASAKAAPHSWRSLDRQLRLAQLGLIGRR